MSLKLFRIHKSAVVILIFQSVCLLLAMTMGCSRSASKTSSNSVDNLERKYRYSDGSKNGIASLNATDQLASRILFLASNGKQCSGFLFDNSHVVTAKHCVADNAKCSDITLQRQQDLLSSADVSCVAVRHHATRDIAVIDIMPLSASNVGTLSLPQRYDLKWLPRGYPQQIEAGVFGYSESAYLTLAFECYVTDVLNVSESGFIMHDCNTDQGMSGGLIYALDKGLPPNENVRVMGIHKGASSGKNVGVMFDDETVGFIRWNMQSKDAEWMQWALSKGVYLEELLDPNANLLAQITPQFFEKKINRILFSLFSEDKYQPTPLKINFETKLLSRAQSVDLILKLVSLGPDLGVPKAPANVVPQSVGFLDTQDFSGMQRLRAACQVPEMTSDRLFRPHDSVTLQEAQRWLAKTLQCVGYQPINPNGYYPAYVAIP